MNTDDRPGTDDAPPPTDTPSPTLAVSIAETVARCITHATTTASPSSQQDSAEVQAITDAMTRLLVGIPLRSDGQLTVKSLAEEAGLKRNKLTHKHTGLKDLLYALVRAQQGRPRVVDGMAEQIQDLKSQLARVRADRDALHIQVKQLARVVHVLEVENRQIRKSVDQGGVVRVMPQRRADPGNDTNHLPDNHRRP